MDRHGYPTARARIGPSPVFENEQPELLESARARRCSGAIAATGAGGGVSSVQLFNPADSTVVVFVELASVSSAAAMTVRLRQTRTALATLTTAGVLLGKPGALSRAQIRSATTGDVGGDDLDVQNILASSPYTPELLYEPLEPGHGLYWITDTADALIRAAFRWREVLRELTLPR